MSERRTIRPHVGAGGTEPDEITIEAERFREAFARWAASVTLVAVRGEGGKVHATTVSSFAPVSARPPMLVLSLGAGAQVLPFIAEGEGLGISLLREDQSSWASIFADSFPVRSPEWTEGTVPTVPGSVAAFDCTVVEVHPVEGGSRVVVCRVEAIELGEEDRPLMYWKRAYRRLDE